MPSLIKDPDTVVSHGPDPTQQKTGSGSATLDGTQKREMDEMLSPKLEIIIVQK